MSTLLEQANKPLDEIDVRVPAGLYEFEVSGGKEPVSLKRGPMDNQWEVIEMRVQGNLTEAVDVDDMDSWDSYVAMMGENPSINIDVDITPRPEGSARSLQDLRRALDAEPSVTATELVQLAVGQKVYVNVVHKTNDKGYTNTYYNFRKVA